MDNPYRSMEMNIPEFKKSFKNTRLYYEFSKLSPIFSVAQKISSRFVLGNILFAAAIGAWWFLFTFPSDVGVVVNNQINVLDNQHSWNPSAYWFVGLVTIWTPILSYFLGDRYFSYITTGKNEREAKAALFEERIFNKRAFEKELSSKIDCIGYQYCEVKSEIRTLVHKIRMLDFDIEKP